MPSFTIRVYEELNDFIPRKFRKRSFSHTVFLPTTVKDIIQSLGIPHTEVDLILVNGHSVGFDFKPENGDHISVYPVFESLDIEPLTRLLKRPLRDPRFIADNPLRKCVRWLRLLGFDTKYVSDYSIPQIIDLSREESRIIITRNRQLLMPNKVPHGLCVHSDDPVRQTAEVIHRLQLDNKIVPYSRCMHCNGIIISVEKEKIQYLLKEKTAKFYSNFRQCEGCKKVYWRGSHGSKLDTTIERIRWLAADGQ